VDTYSIFEVAVDGASNFWTVASGVVSEFAYNATSNTVTPVSPAAGFKGCGGTRQGGTRKALMVDRSGNVWTANASSNGNSLQVIVGAATPVYTPLVPGHQGALP
jgi:hypothetical protein